MNCLKGKASFGTQALIELHRAKSFGVSGTMGGLQTRRLPCLPLPPSEASYLGLTAGLARPMTHSERNYFEVQYEATWRRLKYKNTDKTRL